MNLSASHAIGIPLPVSANGAPDLRNRGCSSALESGDEIVRLRMAD